MLQNSKTVTILLTLTGLVGIMPGSAEHCSPVAAKTKMKLGAQNLQKIAAGSSSGISRAGQFAIRDKAAWTKLWAQHTSYIKPAPDLPPVDFSRQMILAAFAGNKSSGGHTISIEQVVQTAKELKVRVAESSPPSGAMTTQAITQPYDIVAVPLSASPVDWGRPGSASVSSKVITEEEQKKTLEYWTPERMRNAKPMPMPTPRLERRGDQ